MNNGIQINESVTQLVRLHGQTICVRRLDLLHPLIGGNKYYKLKYNVEAVMRSGHKTLLTFGGAYSNHLYATAAAGKLYGFKTIGIVRGEELGDSALSPTLQFAKECGMRLEFVLRSAYAEKETEEFKGWLHEEFGAFHLVPEGGSNFLGINGCMEILSNEDKTDYDVVCCACGTGATLAGMVLSLGEGQRALGFSAHKNGDWLRDEVMKHLHYFLMDGDAADEYAGRFEIVTDYSFGGYAKWDATLLAFMALMENEQGLPLEQVYTGKMMYGIADMLGSGRLSGDARVLALHTGGMQGRVRL